MSESEKDTQELHDATPESVPVPDGRDAVLAWSVGEIIRLRKDIASVSHSTLINAFMIALVVWVMIWKFTQIDTLGVS